MAFFNKNQNETNQPVVNTEAARPNLKKRLAPLRDIARFAIEQKNKLQAEESVTIEE